MRPLSLGKMLKASCLLAAVKVENVPCIRPWPCFPRGATSSVLHVALRHLVAETRAASTQAVFNRVQAGMSTGRDEQLNQCLIKTIHNPRKYMCCSNVAKNNLSI